MSGRKIRLPKATGTYAEPMHLRDGHDCGLGGGRPPYAHRRVWPRRPRHRRRGRDWQGERGLPRAGGAIRVDLAFVWWYQDDAAAMLEEMAVPVVRIRSGRAAELPAMIRLIGDCVDCGRRPTGRGASKFVSRQVVDATGTAAKRVFLELYGPLKTVGRDTYTNDLLEFAGGRNVAADAKGTVVFSAERLVQADPDVILVRRRGLGAGSVAYRGRAWPN